MIKAKLNNVSVSYNKKDLILKNLNLDIYEGELLSLLGPSGCGKSTTLRSIAGFIEMVDGNFEVDGETYTNKGIHERDFGIVFQSYALFPHLSVYDNVAFGLKLRKTDKKEIKERVSEILKICNLDGFENRFPKNLSGGQRQRVALARALVIKPKLLLLDEPLSNLDAQLRIQMRHEIRRIQKELNITTIFVTHDQEECFAISDRVAVMKDGQIEQLDTPENIYDAPISEYVARFVGFENFIEAKYLEQSNEGTYGCIRPQDIEINQEGEYNGTVTSYEFLGGVYQWNLKSNIGNITCNNSQRPSIGDNVKFNLNKDKLRFV